jgi:NAD-dependent SIR2 family protein deacetylase
MCLDARTLCGPRARPEAVYDALQLLWPRDAWKPTLAHHFLRVLHDKGKLLRVYTQNIDDLDVAAGIPHEKLVRLHGSFEHMVVVDGYGRRVGLVPSHQRLSVEAMILSGKVPVVKLKRSHPNPQPNLMSTLNAQMKLKMSYTEYLEVEEYDSVLRNPNVLYDDASYGFVRPDVTLYYDDVGGRMDVWDLADAHDADLVLVIGTALQVQPASDIARPSVRFPRVWINAGRDPLSFRFDHRVFATADVFARETARALGWESELDSLASGSSGSSSSSSSSSSSCDGSSAPSIC